MLSMRHLLSVAALAMLANAAPALATTVTTPADGAATTTVESFCVLDGLTFTNGLTFTKATAAGVPQIGGLEPNWFHYVCQCDSASFNNGGTFTTQVVPHTYDYGSSAEISLNNVGVNTKAQGNAISNQGTVENSPQTQSSAITLANGWNTINIGVSCNGMGEPNPCYYNYQVQCYKPTPGVIGDPQFVGLRGQSYQVHGVAGEIYNIVSDSDVQYNSRFAFLDHGECPVVNGKKQKNCYSHPGSYLGELGLKTKSGDRIHLRTGSAKQGYKSVTVNDKEVEVGQTIVLADNMGSVSRNSTHLAAVQVGNWDFEFENSDKFVNQKVRVIDSRKLRSHGLLGQTWRKTTYPNAVKYIQGTVDDYVIREGGIFGDNFLYNTFN